MLASARMMDGKLILETNVSDLTAAAVVLRYNALTDIERSLLGSRIPLRWAVRRAPMNGVRERAFRSGQIPLKNISAAADGTGAQVKDCYKLQCNLTG